jgi:hypothetical protein
MIDNKDFDFIKEKFDSDGIETPESLSADNMMKMLEKERTQALRRTRQESLRSL